jgi:hypothetical protein
MAPILNRAYVASIDVNASFQVYTKGHSYCCKFYIIPQRYGNSVSLSNSQAQQTMSKGITPSVEIVIGQALVLMPRDDATLKSMD